MVIVGRISGVYGVRGWVRIYSYTEPRENIIGYRPWYLRKGGDWRKAELSEGHRQGKGVVARLAECDNRDQAYALLDCEIGVSREQLPATAPGEYYWSELQGLKVISTDGESLGTVDHLLETGANDVLVVKGERERLIPFVMDQVIIRVDLERGQIRVNWDKEF